MVPPPDEGKDIPVLIGELGESYGHVLHVELISHKVLSSLELPPQAQGPFPICRVELTSEAILK